MLPLKSQACPAFRPHLVDALADRMRGREVKCRALDWLDLASGNQGGIYRKVMIPVVDGELMPEDAAAGVASQVEIGVLRDVDCRAAVGGRREEQRGKNLSWKSGATSLVCPVGLKERMRNVEREVQRSRKAKCAHSQMMSRGMQRLRGARLVQACEQLHPHTCSHITIRHHPAPHQPGVASSVVAVMMVVSSFAVLDSW